MGRVTTAKTCKKRREGRLTFVIDIRFISITVHIINLYIVAKSEYSFDKKAVITAVTIFS